MIAASVFTAGPPTTVIRVTFDIDMDIFSLPALTVWRLLVDGVPTSVIIHDWQDNRTINLSYTGNPPTTTGSVRLLTADPDLRSSLGAIAKAPQTVAFFP